jgi:hypothetical protein
MLKVVQSGLASDPLGIQPFFETDKKDDISLILYRSIRAINYLEEGVHPNLIRSIERLV